MTILPWLAYSPLLLAACIEFAPDDSMESLVARHQAAARALAGLSCHVKMRTTQQVDGKPRSEECSGTFFFDHGLARARILDRGEDVTYVWRDGIVTALSDRGGVQGVIRMRQQRHSKRCDPMVRGLISMGMPLGHETIAS